MTLRGRLERVAGACACAQLRRAARALTQEYDAALRPAGLRATQFTLLVATALSPGAPLSAVGEALGMDRTTLTRNLGPLARRGLLRVESSPLDGRKKTLRLTAKGSRAMASAVTRWTPIQERVVARLGQGWPAMARDLRVLTG